MLFKWSTDCQSSIYQDSLRIREKVFIDEQAVPKELEIDDLENQCAYVVAYADHSPIATARLFVTTNKGKIQRVAVSKAYRNKGIGKQLMQEIENYALPLGINTLYLGAQNHAIPFYETLGFTVCSEEYLDAGILHHDMEKRINA